MLRLTELAVKSTGCSIPFVWKWLTAAGNGLT